MQEIVSINPATLEKIGRVPITPEQKVKEYVSKARSAQPSWSRLAFKERAAYLLKAREYLLKNIDNFALTITRDNGKPITESISAEILPVCDLFYWAAKSAEKILSPERLCVGIFDLMFRSSRICHEPLGVIGIISPWNYPFSIPVGAAAMALMAGNCVVLKPSSATPMVGKKIEELFNAAGLPEFVFTHIPGDSTTGEALLDCRLDKVIFTGSVNIGMHVAELCAKKLVPTVLELGGKDAAIIRPDANLDVASSGVVWGAFTNTGQCCASIERVYVHESIAKDFTDLVVSKTLKLRVGNGEEPETDIGPMTTRQQLETVERHVEEARAKGAKILCGGKIPPAPPLQKGGETQLSPPLKKGGTGGFGYFYEPTVLTEVDHSFSCVNEETFGPTLPIMTYSDDQQAIQLANDSQFALNAYIWGKNIKAAQKMAKNLMAGTVVINDSVYTHAIAQTPWGGLKHSGWGRTHGKWGFYEVTNLHHIHTNHLTFIKDFWWYPYSKGLTKTLKKLANSLTGNSWHKTASLLTILKILLMKKL